MAMQCVNLRSNKENSMARSSKKNYPSNSTTTALVPSAGAALTLASAMTSDGRRAIQATQTLREQISIDEARSAAMLFKAITAQQRENQLTLRTLAQYDHFAQAVRLVLDQPRDERVQVLVE